MEVADRRVSAIERRRVDTVGEEIIPSGVTLASKIPIICRAMASTLDECSGDVGVPGVRGGREWWWSCAEGCVGW